MYEIRWHGRGGQGVVTASEILAKSCIIDNYFSQHFPEFGPERRGAPVRAFTRISEDEIELHCGIYSPDFVVVLDPSLLKLKDWITSGEKENTVYLINSENSPEYLKNKRVYCINAAKIAEEIFGKPFYNTIMLGALINILGIPSLKAVEKVMEEKWKENILEKNLAALKEGYKQI